jgi:hypothetical protein
MTKRSELRPLVKKHDTICARLGLRSRQVDDGKFYSISPDPWFGGATSKAEEMTVNAGRVIGQQRE